MTGLIFWVGIDGVKHRLRLGDPTQVTNLIYPSDALFSSDTLFPEEEYHGLQQANMAK